MNSIKINIPEGYEVDVFNKETGEVAFKQIKSKYPLSITELCITNTWYVSTLSDIRCNGICKRNRSYIDLNTVSSEKRAKAILALIQLVELRDAWNKIDNFVVNWSSNTQFKNCIYQYQNNFICEDLVATYTILYFGSRKTRDLFLNTFKDLIETAKEFL